MYSILILFHIYLCVCFSFISFRFLFISVLCIYYEYNIVILFYQFVSVLFIYFKYLCILVLFIDSSRVWYSVATLAARTRTRDPGDRAAGSDPWAALPPSTPPPHRLPESLARQAGEARRPLPSHLCPCDLWCVTDCSRPPRFPARFPPTSGRDSAPPPRLAPPPPNPKKKSGGEINKVRKHSNFFIY